MVKPNTVRYDRIRHLILQSLREEYPKTLDVVVLRRHLANFGYPMSEEDLDFHIAYLEEKSLVKVEKRPGDIVFIRTTTAGIDALDERIEVKGVGQDL